METLGDLSILPKDVLILLISEHFDIKDLYHLGLVNKFSSKIIRETDLIWKTIYFRLYHSEQQIILPENTTWREFVRENTDFFVWHPFHRDLKETLISKKFFFFFFFFFFFYGKRGQFFQGGKWLPDQI